MSPLLIKIITNLKYSWLVDSYLLGLLLLGFGNFNPKYTVLYFMKFNLNHIGIFSRS